MYVSTIHQGELVSGIIAKPPDLSLLLRLLDQSQINMRMPGPRETVIHWRMGDHNRGRRKRHIRRAIRKVLSSLDMNTMRITIITKLAFAHTSGKGKWAPTSQKIKASMRGFDKLLKELKSRGYTVRVESSGSADYHMWYMTHAYQLVTTVGGFGEVANRMRRYRNIDNLSRYRINKLKIADKIWWKRARKGNH